MVFNWFFKDEFEKFYKRIERLQGFMRMSERGLSLDRFVELKRHLRVMRGLFPQLLGLYEEELRTINSMPESEYKKRLVTFSQDLHVRLNDLQNLISSALSLVEEILKVRTISQVKEQREKLERIIQNIHNTINTAQRESFALIKYEREWKRSVARVHAAPVSRIQIIGRLFNGWRLSDIQSVIIDLGGFIEATPGRPHPYRIVFPTRDDRAKATIPLAVSVHPFKLVREVSRATGINNRVLIASFSHGHLVTA